MSASIGSIWRYPVKSMAGEELASSDVTERGLLGDRAYALVDKHSNRAATVRTWGMTLLNYGAHRVTPPERNAPAPPVRITFPNGATLMSDQPETARLLSDIFGHALAILASAPEGLRVEFPAARLGGAYEQATAGTD